MRLLGPHQALVPCKGLTSLSQSDTRFVLE
jgi:hypothetical protein